MTTNLVSSSTPAAGSSTPSQAQKATDPLTNKNTFIQLLVAQLKNQNPLNPADGTQFVTQLAQFSSLEQSTQMRDDLDAIRQQLAAQAAAAAPPATSATTGTAPSNS